MFQNIGTTEYIVLALVILVLFGGKKIPELMRGVGEAIREFRKAMEDDGKKDN
jgi:sec-independent protein translocase protein TatA